MVYSDYVKYWTTVNYHRLKGPSIAKALCWEGIKISYIGVHKLLSKSMETGIVTRHAGSGRLLKATQTTYYEYCRRTNAQWWPDNSEPTPEDPGRSCLWIIVADYFAQSKDARLDLSQQQCILPADQRRKQSQKTRICHWEPLVQLC